MSYNPDLLVSEDFLLTAAILRHYEKQRVATANRLHVLTEFPRHKEWGMHLPDSHPDVIMFREYLAEITATENEKIETLTAMFKASPLYPWTSRFKGLAPGKLVARFLGETGDPYLQVSGLDPSGEPLTEPRRRTFRQLKKLTGFSVEDGKSPRHAAGQQSGFRGRARTRMWLITDQLVKQHDPVFYPVFEQGVIKYKDEQYRGHTPYKGGKTPERFSVLEDGTMAVPWSDERFGVIGRKRARVLTSVAFMEGLYSEARRLHEEE